MGESAARNGQWEGNGQLGRDGTASHRRCTRSPALTPDHAQCEVALYSQGGSGYQPGEGSLMNMEKWWFSVLWPTGLGRISDE